jgi:hypothetical protein
MPARKSSTRVYVFCAGGAEGGRTPDLLIANEALSQLSYGPATGSGAGRQRRACENLHLGCALGRVKNNETRYCPPESTCLFGLVRLVKCSHHL